MFMPTTPHTVAFSPRSSVTRFSVRKKWYCHSRDRWRTDQALNAHCAATGQCRTRKMMSVEMTGEQGAYIFQLVRVRGTFDLYFPPSLTIGRRQDFR